MKKQASLGGGGKEYDSSSDSPIQIRGKKTYGFVQRLFCCKCFGCCQEEDRSLLTSNNRKDISKRLISQFKSDKDHAIEDPLQILIRLYIDDEDKELIYQLLNKTRINPDLSENHIWRDDLEFYLPQICNFLVFHEELKNDNLKEFLKKAGMIDFYFAHLLCFYMKSVAQTVNKNQIQDFPQVWNVVEEFSDCFMEFYYGKQLVSAEMVEQLAMGKQYAVPHKLNKSNIVNENNDDEQQQKQKQQIIQNYGTSYYEKGQNIMINPEDIELSNYINIADYLSKNERINSSQLIVDQADNKNNNNGGVSPEQQKLNNDAEINSTNQEIDLKYGFSSTISFFNDIINISENLKYSDPKIVSLRHELQKINSQLPAAVYVPFFTNHFRNHVVLNIVTQECKVFSTKERSPFYICLELYRSEETSKQDANSPLLYIQEKLKNGETRLKWNYDERLSHPLTINNQEYHSQKLKITEESIKPSTQIKKNQGFDQSNTNTALLDQKNNDSMMENGVNSMVQNNIKNGQQQQKNYSQIDLESNNNRPAVGVSKTIDIDNKLSFRKKNMTNNRSIDISMNSNQNQKKGSFPNSNNLIHNDSVLQDSTSGISCVYERGMRIPSHYNLKDLEWQTIKPDEKNEIQQQQQQQQEQQQEQQLYKQEINVPINHLITESNENSDNNLNIVSKNFGNQDSQYILDKQIPNSTDSIRPSRHSKHQFSNIDLNEEKYKGLKSLFGEDTQEQEKRIRKASPFGHFKSWKLVHMIVKTGDNIKQEQLAVQLIYQFDQIFKMEGLDLKLTPYEIVSLGPQCGIMEMVKNSITLDGLMKQIHSYKEIKDLHQFFQLYYGSQFKKAQQNFCSSLVAYSLVCYFLQIKDRHNGNILLHKNGHIIHIDFGFFLSNAPGKGLAFEQNVPFKLLSDYISILGGVESEQFQNFRRLFFKGFQAACKHQDKILILVKMLYSGHGLTLPCFEKGEQCINDLESRFNPPDISNDGELSMHCNMLINQSLDNWRARWYDKWQYFCQGIFY